METHPVINLIKKRYSENSKPGLRKDPHKLGLVLEGGGMRGVVSAAMASALHYLGLVEVFDAVYGSSAGALAGSLFITNNMPLGPTMYYDDLNKNEFINFKRIFSNKTPIMNLDFLLVDILQGRKPLNWKAVLNSKIPLNTVVSSINQRKSLAFNKYEKKEDLFTLLKASANIPFVAGPPIKYKGDLLFDASVYESIPYKTAFADECTHILNLLTRPRGILRGRPSVIEKLLIAKKMYKLKPGLDEDYLNRAKTYKEDIEFLYKENNNLDSSKPIFSIYPPEGTAEISRMEKDRTKLIEGSITAMKEVTTVFGVEVFDYHEVLCPFNKLGTIPKINN